ncbi:sterol desaturase family protein [Algoriphagus antarcticus]|uniref:Sterol desaturase/sphingolipid hydroxylase (Fatty acid hydroxylase superfamily) n=1 Tax=Algoriphagus antarcticus TaxID=238540 RepID=A0A3E0DY85_9BACT|nr:sterol desaturase family protein [Algoriphagus antarcticus]REG91054.1 sterol desaturase/sphingolipid hydroxylase (fatty acid hydroxylase superfamily) [Algoriphagus antarcticus]
MKTLEYLLSIDLNYIVIGLIVIFFTLEQVLSTQFSFQKRGRHFWNSFLFQVVFFIGNLFWAIAFVFCIQWLNEKEFGLFFLVELPVWLKLVLGVLLLDLATYWFHRISHVVPVLWRFHRVHHSDTTMDSSTYFRAHPIEVFFWFGSAPILMAGIFGLDLLAVGLYFLVVTPFVIIEHCNLRFPSWLDNTVGLVITTPNLHKIHHDQDQNFTDSNFADIFILWDRIFGTYTYKPADQVKFGLKEFEKEEKQTFWYLLRSPFIRIERNGKDGLEKK